MKWYILCHLGAEKALERELALYDLSCEKLLGGVAIECDKQTLSHVAYQLQTATRVLIAIDKGPLESIDLKGALKHIPEGKTFAVEADVIISSDMQTSVDIAAQLGQQVDRPVNLSHPDYRIFCQVGPTCIAGIDCMGDLSKRYYRIFGNSRSVKGTLAASIYFAFEPGNSILDPFGNTGEIAIEAALHANNVSPRKFEKHMRTVAIDTSLWKDEEKEGKPVHCFDPKLASVRSAKKNAKLAGVDKFITFSKLDAEWLDVKFDEGDIDTIISIPSPVTKRDPDTSHLKELCYQAEFILKNKGRLIVACATEDTAAGIMKYASEYKLTLKDEAVIYSGKLPYHVMCYEL